MRQGRRRGVGSALRRVRTLPVPGRRHGSSTRQYRGRGLGPPCGGSARCPSPGGGTDRPRGNTVGEGSGPPCGGSARCPSPGGGTGRPRGGHRGRGIGPVPRRSRALLLEERRSVGMPAQLGVPEQADRAVHAVVTGVSNHLLFPQAGHRLGDEGRRGGSDVFQRNGVEKRQLRSEPAQEAFVVPGDGLALRADPVDLGQDLGQGNQTPHRAGGLGRRDPLPTVRQILDPVHDPDGQRLAADRAPAPVLPRLAGREADVAVAGGRPDGTCLLRERTPACPRIPRPSPAPCAERNNPARCRRRTPPFRAFPANGRPSWTPVESDPGTTPASSSAGPTRDRSPRRKCGGSSPRSSRRWRRTPDFEPSAANQGVQIWAGTRYEPGSDSRAISSRCRESRPRIGRPSECRLPILDRLSTTRSVASKSGV